MKEELNIDLQNIDETAKIAKAFASNVRLEILKILKQKPLNISEIAEKTGIPISSAALHIKTLEDAGILITKSLPGLRGSQKVCALKIEKVDFTIVDSSGLSKDKNVITEAMPIGNYFDCQVAAPCGISSENQLLASEDSIYGFFSPERSEAQILWFTTGYLEYRFSNQKLKKVHSLKSLEFTFEICSEAPGYHNDWKSDITFWINNIELGYTTTPADFGGRRGNLNPSWWDDNMTQFGLLKKISVTENGTYIDGIRISDLRLGNLHLKENCFLSFKIGIKEDSKYVGGLNLFGDKFGDYPQNIHMDIIY